VTFSPKEEPPGRLLVVVLGVLMASLSSGCSLKLSQVGPPRCGPPDLPYVYAGRADFEAPENGWGRPVGRVVYQGHEYDEYEHSVHAPRDVTNPYAYMFLDVVTLGVSEVVTTPIELVRVSGLVDYKERVRVEWDDGGALVAWVVYWDERWGRRYPPGWGERETTLPAYIRERRAREAPAVGGGAPSDVR